jgi:hypothetical protein
MVMSWVLFVLVFGPALIVVFTAGHQSGRRCRSRGGSCYVSVPVARIKGLGSVRVGKRL